MLTSSSQREYGTCIPLITFSIFNIKPLLITWHVTTSLHLEACVSTRCSPILLKLVWFLMFSAGSPAQRAGLKAGQVLLSVNGVNVLELSHREIIKLVQKGKMMLYRHQKYKAWHQKYVMLDIINVQTKMINIRNHQTTALYTGKYLSCFVFAPFALDVRGLI